jgi:hypothetical protein
MTRSKRILRRSGTAAKVFVPPVRASIGAKRNMRRRRHSPQSAADYPQRFHDLMPLFLPRGEFLRLKATIDPLRKEVE